MTIRSGVSRRVDVAGDELKAIASRLLTSPSYFLTSWPNHRALRARRNACTVVRGAIKRNTQSQASFFDMPSGSGYSALRTDPDTHTVPYTIEDAVGEIYSEGRLPSKEERKRIWWRNAVINLMFIAAWYVRFLPLSHLN